MDINFLALTGLAVWLLALTLIATYILRFFRKISKDVGSGNLIKVLENVIDSEKRNSKSIEELRKHLLILEDEGKQHVQKTGLVRFNPFKEMGGDHSFSLALLDGMETGVVITGLHTRERTRVYVKAIKKGKSKIELSKEEEKALKMAQNS